MMSPERRETWLRWFASGLLVVAAHGGAAVAMLHGSPASEPDDPAAAMMIELAPMPVAAVRLPAEELPPGPEQVQADAAVSPPAEQREEQPEKKQGREQADERQPEIPPAENPELAVAAKPPEPEQKVSVPEESQVSAPVTTAPQAPHFEQAAVTAAPAQGPVTISNSNAVPNWRRQIVTRLERHKRYPAAAHARHERGTAQLVFRLDRDGRVTETHIARSSGSAVLDQEALEIVRRAQPFPALPPEIAGPHVELSVPIRFNLR
jgi:protein TonB